MLFLLGLVLGVIFAFFFESLLHRMVVIALASLGVWALNNGADLTRPKPEASTTSLTEIKKEEVKLEDVQVSRAGSGGYALSGNVANESNSRLTTVYFQLTLTDCQGSTCRVVGQEDAAASVNVPPQQTRAFGSTAVRFNDLPAPGPAKSRRSWTYSVTSLKGRPEADQQHQTSASDRMAAAIPDH